MKARVMQNGNGKSHFEISADEIPDKLMSSKLLVAGLVNGLKNVKLSHAQETFNMVRNVISAIDVMPAHSGYASWTKLNDFQPKGWKWVCNNCLKIAYAPPKDGECDLEFCPHCGCRMIEELPECMEV